MSGGHFDIVRDALVVAPVRMMGCARRRLRGRFVRGHLVGEMMQSCEVVLDLLIGGERSFAVIRDGFIVARARLLVCRRACAEVEQWDGCGGAEGPHSR